jgi:hypothetical protein
VLQRSWGTNTSGDCSSFTTAEAVGLNETTYPASPVVQGTLLDYLGWGKEAHFLYPQNQKVRWSGLALFAGMISQT